MRYVHRVCPLTEEKEELGFPTTIASTRILAFFTCLVNLSCSCTSPVFRFPAPIEPDLVGHDRENELVRFVIQDMFLSLSSFTQRWFLFIEGFLKIRTTVTVFFTDYSLKTIFLKPAQKDCKYLSYDLSGLMSLQNNILSRFLSIRSFVHLTMSESIGKSKKSNDGFITDLADYWTTKMSTERAVAGDDHLLLSLIKYWNFEYTIYYILFVLYIVQYPF